MSILLVFASAVVSQADACALLAPKEIASVQGELPKETKPSVRTEGALQISECVFVLPTYAKSVSLQVTRGTKDEARQRWKQLFHSEQRAAGAAQGEEREERIKPEAVRGLGDESFWVPVRPAGALYVLRKKAFLRISLGGSDAPEAKIQRSKKLARMALRRL
jgi:hypothetical protein